MCSLPWLCWKSRWQLPILLLLQPQSLQRWFACITLHDLYAFSPGSSRSLHQRTEMQQLGCCVVPTLSIPTLSLNLYLQDVELLSFAYAFRQVEISVCQTLSSSYSLVHWCHGQITHSFRPWMGKGIMGWGNIQTSDLGPLFKLLSKFSCDPISLSTSGFRLLFGFGIERTDSLQLPSG